MSDTIHTGTIEALRALDSCSVANAIEACDIRLRNEGYTSPRLCCRVPGLPPMVGYAVTMRVRAGSPPMKGGTYLDRTDWWTKIESFTQPRIMVIQDMDERPGRGAFIGEVHATILHAMGFTGAVTNGAVRDLPGIEKLGFNLYSENLSVSHAYAHVVEFGTPVEIAGLKIKPGDLLHGDQHGIVRVPLQVADDLPRIAAALRKREKVITTFCRSSDFSVAGLHEVITRSAMITNGGAQP